MSEMLQLQQIATMPRNYLNRKILINKEGTKYKVIDDVIQTLDWKITTSDTEPHIFWKDTYVTDEEYRKLLPYQRINHFPGSYLLGKKNELCKSLNRMRKQFPDDYDFFPKTWLLPYQSEEVRNRSGLYIVKPEANCQGRGIFLTKKLEPYLDKHYVVQEYISDPLLIDELKFDLRIYVLLKSVAPLKIFMYKEGLARFSTKKYVKPHKKNLSNVTMHLTNYAINKRSSNFIFNLLEEQDDVGHKRSLTSVYKVLQSQGHDVQKLQQDIQSLLIKTFCAPLVELTHLYRAGQPCNETLEQCFELFGIDILLDSNLKPWLLEVNHTPSFAIDTPLDKTIKKSLILDTLILLDIRNKPKELYLQQKRAPIYTRPTKLSVDEKVLINDKFNAYELSHLHGYDRIYPNENLALFDKFLPPKPKERPQSLRKRLNTNSSFSEFETKASSETAQLTTRNVPRMQSINRPLSSVSQVNRPPSGFRRQMQKEQQQQQQEYQQQQQQQQQQQHQIIKCQQPAQSQQFQLIPIQQHFQTQVLLPSRNSQQYPPKQSMFSAEKPSLRMIPIKTFNFEKIDFQKNE